MAVLIMYSNVDLGCHFQSNLLSLRRIKMRNAALTFTLMQILENIEDDWPLLWNAYYEFYKRVSDDSAEALSNRRRKSLCKKSDGRLLFSGKWLPTRIAWDPVKNQVKYTYMYVTPFQVICWWLFLIGCKLVNTYGELQFRSIRLFPIELFWNNIIYICPH